MVYPAPFYRLVILGTIYNDVFNTTLSFIPAGGGTVPPSTQALSDAMGAAVRAWWSLPPSQTPGGGAELIAASRLTGVKFNRIGADGRYLDDPIETVLTPIGGGAGNIQVPPQLSVAATLRGPNERQRAGRGRMYLPPTASTTQGIGTDGRMAITAATNVAAGVVTLIQNLNDVTFAASVPAVAGIASKAGAGAFQAVERVTVGRVVDTIRSRRNKLSEDFVEVAV
jgi:hypothetical protein